LLGFLDLWFFFVHLTLIVLNWLLSVQLRLRVIYLCYEIVVRVSWFEIFVHLTLIVLNWLIIQLRLWVIYMSKIGILWLLIGVFDMSKLRFFLLVKDLWWKWREITFW
jgi:hypothetical protein